MAVRRSAKRRFGQMLPQLTPINVWIGLPRLKRVAIFQSRGARLGRVRTHVAGAKPLRELRDML